MLDFAIVFEPRKFLNEHPETRQARANKGPSRWIPIVEEQRENRSLRRKIVTTGDKLSSSRQKWLNDDNFNES